MTATEEQVFTQVLEAALAMYDRRLVVGTAGNVSGRLPDGDVVMTPSSLPYEGMTVDDLVVCDLDGEKVRGKGSPTSEKVLHLDVYRRYPEVGGVMHSHATHASMFALVREPIPAAIEEVVVYIGGDIPCAEYRTTGTTELGEQIAARLADRSAVLVANHGVVAIGKDPNDALHATEVVERTAEIVWGARALGTPAAIPAKVNADFANVYEFVRHNLWQG